MLQGRTYVPMLHARLAEMRALRELPNSTKNKILPVIKARPWLNSKSLDAVWLKIAESFEGRFFGLDLDQTRYLPSDPRVSYQDFAALFDPADGFENYYSLVDELSNAIPVLRSGPTGPSDLDAQLDFVEELDRGLFVRIQPSQAGNLSSLATDIFSRISENVVFVFDCGWGRDILNQAALCTRLADNVLNINENFEIVVGGSSFPNSFSKQGERISTSMIERLLFQEVRRNLNRGVLVYGDWGSTRPPTDPVPMKNIPRIDFALSDTWIAHRSDGEDDYETLANSVLEDTAFAGDLGIWGEYMIESTASGLEPAIKSPAMAAAVRVNLHMHIQANFDDPGALVVADEPFDDI